MPVHIVQHDADTKQTQVHNWVSVIQVLVKSSCFDNEPANEEDEHGKEKQIEDVAVMAGLGHLCNSWHCLL